MKTDNFWGDKVEYIQKLAVEIADLKGVLQDISQQVRRIERRIDLILPDGKKVKRHKTTNGKRMTKAPKMSETQARQTINQLIENLREGNSIESKLRNMTVKHELTYIARELGMTNRALPPKVKLVMNIITRLRQTVMLTENIRKMPRVDEEERVAEKEKSYGDRDNAHR